MLSRQEISEATGFDNGDHFNSRVQAMGYFTVENIIDMFGECTMSQDDLNDMAEEVIANEWHCQFSKEVK